MYLTNLVLEKELLVRNTVHVVCNISAHFPHGTEAVGASRTSVK